MKKEEPHLHLIGDKKRTIENIVLKIKNPKILELGVHHGVSTKLFLGICEKNNGHLTSIDIKDDSSVSTSSRWKFILSSDDNFEYIEKFLKHKFDVLLIDSLHDPDHIQKIFYFYFHFVKLGGIILIDDISWLPYVKSSAFNNDYIENINREIFSKILEIYNSNVNNFSLSFDFKDTGLAILRKKTENLNVCKKIISSEYSVKNLIKKFIYKPKPKL